MSTFRIWRSTNFLVCAVIGETYFADCVLGSFLWTQCFLEFFSRRNWCCVQRPLLLRSETKVSQSQTGHEKTWEKKFARKDKDERDDAAKP
jgi:hypothetical protein